MATVEVTKDNFKSLVLESKLPVLVDFWAPWCGPCRMVAPVLDELSNELEGKAIIAKLNVDNDVELAQQFGVISIPTLIVFKNGVQAGKVVGFRDKAEFVKLLGV
jgi:thioredoxin 1